MMIGKNMENNKNKPERNKIATHQMVIANKMMMSWNIKKEITRKAPLSGMMP